MAVIRTFTVTVAGGKYYIDGVQQPTINLAEGAVYKFDTSDSSVGSHPFKFSTTSDGTHSGGTEYTTGVTSGTGYVQISVATSAPTLYYYCSVHSGMGGQANTVDSNTWGILNWGEGNWGDQQDNIASVTGQAITPALGTVQAFNETGWGRKTWGSEDWGDSGASVQVALTGVSTSFSVGTTVVEDDIEVGWGRKTWGNLAWGDAYSAALVGQQINIGLGTTVPKADAIVKPTAVTITSGYGLVDLECDGTYVHVHDPEITVSVGSAIVTDYDIVSLTGVQITSAINPATTIGGVDVKPTAVTITSGFGSTFRAFTDITIRPTGFGISTGLGSVDAVSKVEIVGQVITSSLGNVTTKQTAVIKPDGIAINTGIGTANGLAWAKVDTGTTVTWTQIAA
tara:strand:- start:1132 stop:2322 length:1191 start_codon:yes stop_codon:yes gene_type:complete